MNPIDLSALRMTSEAPAMPRRPLGPRLLTLAALLLLLGVVLSFAWPLLRPVRAVAMAPVRSADAPGAASTTAVAEAVGWVEADPFPVVVRPLVAGRIESILVLEGAQVKAGVTVVATLADAALQAACERAQAITGERQAAHAAARAALGQARARREQNADARRAVAGARLATAEAEARLAAADGARDRSSAEARGARAALQAQEQLLASGSSNPVALERARADAAAADAVSAAARAEATAAQSAHAAAAAALALAEELAANTVDLDWAVQLAEAEVEKAKAASNTAAAELAIAEREWRWAKAVLAPCDGVVLRLLASPGAATGPDAEGILMLYDPGHLRARIDVPLGSLLGIHAGQDVQLRSEVTGAQIVHGVVQRLQHESDLLKNTLQVKIELQDPPPLWRPETLCRARFLGGDSAAAAPANVFLVPKAALRSGMVFVFDPTRGTARAVAAALVEEQADGVVVRGELSVTQHVILDPVADGERVQEVHR
ncbi:MAG TPA: HlyD family efflux transporter periplasmic adaptor subunit [Planctomycetota bacterium]|nr:HlyD family efflux transporter periplasmic adaptor subunit [Planctomycetota bacterium]